MKQRYRILTTIDNKYFVEKLNAYYNGSSEWWKWSPQSFDSIEDAKKWVERLDPKEEFIPLVVWDSTDDDDIDSNLTRLLKFIWPSYFKKKE